MSLNVPTRCLLLVVLCCGCYYQSLLLLLHAVPVLRSRGGRRAGDISPQFLLAGRKRAGTRRAGGGRQTSAQPNIPALMRCASHHYGRSMLSASAAPPIKIPTTTVLLLIIIQPYTNTTNASYALLCCDKHSNEYSSCLNLADRKVGCCRKNAPKIQIHVVITIV